MNFLAHLYLAEPTPASMIGNLLPDLVRYRHGLELDPEVRLGAETHRFVDVRTDTHPVFLRSKARLFPRHGRYSGILVDLFYDHILATRWDRYHPDPLERFLNGVYASFAGSRHLMPQPMWQIVSRMTEENWLLNYAHLEGINLTLSRMSHRFSVRFNRKVDLASATKDLVESHDALADDFEEFFPQLCGVVYAWRDAQRANMRTRGERPAR